MKKFSIVIVMSLLISMVAYGENGWTHDGTVVRLTTGSDSVGIGTIDPTAKLDISGDINIEDGNTFKIGGDDFIKHWSQEFGFGIGKYTGGEYVDVVYIGDYAGYANSANYLTAVGVNAGRGNGGNSVTTLGHSSGRNNSSAYLTAVGHAAGYGNQGAAVTVVGKEAGVSNTGHYSSGFGCKALHGNTGDNVVAIGHQAGQSNTTSNVFILKHNLVNSTPLIYGNFSNGYVGIGTTSLQSELTVDGTITTREMKVKLTGWPDFVLGGNYKLMPLAKLEQHIKKEKSLPGIPKTVEVEKEGVLVGEMQAKLLEKVEELTLYVIELNKEVQDLRKENEELKKRIFGLEK